MSELFASLRRREGTWVDWGLAFQQLQKEGESSLAIFEETGFTPSQQNQFIVAAQVFASLTPEVAQRFQLEGSDVLYELRLLPQEWRSPTAEFVHQQRMDVPTVREVVKAVKYFASLPSPPANFTNHPGDAIAYQCWRSAREASDPQSKTRLIARGLQYAYSQGARTVIEGLLGDLMSAPAPRVPRLPTYRYENAETLPRLFPVAGRLPCCIAVLQAVPENKEIPPFGIREGGGAWVAVPGYQVVQECGDGVAFLADTRSLAEVTGQEIASNALDKPEELLVLIDRQQLQWHQDHYFVVADGDMLQIKWFAEMPDQPLYGRLLLILRQKKILDELAVQELWQLDE